MTAPGPTDLDRLHPVDDADEIRARLGPFVVELVRALLQQSYYPADHPRTRQVTAEPFAMLKEFGRRWPEFTFARGSLEEGSRTVLIEGVFVEPMALDWLIGGTAGEHFMNKLHDFCSRNRIVSFSIKNYVTDGEFRRFVSIFVRNNPEIGVARELRFTDELLEADVYAVSVVLEADMLRARARLPWRVRLALSRLCKDLTVLPMFEHASDEDLHDAKLRTLQDVIRPLIGGPYLRSFFLNLDLIAKQIPGLHGEQIEEAVVQILPDDVIARLAGELITVFDSVTQGGGEAEQHVAVTEPLRAIAQRLARLRRPGTVDTLRELYERDLLAYQALPPELQQELKSDHLMDEFADDPSRFGPVFDGLADAAVYATFLRDLITAYPRIVRAGGHDLAAAISDALYEHRKNPGAFSARADLVSTVLSDLRAPHVRACIDALAQGENEERHHLQRLFLSVGRGAIPATIEALAQTRSETVRTEVGLALGGMGTEGAAAIRAALAEGTVKPAAAVVLIGVLARLRDPMSLRLLQRHMKHPAPEVRESAIDAVADLGNEDSAAPLLAALSDPEPGVVVRALRACEALMGPDPVLASRLLALVPDCGPTPRPVHRQLNAAREALAALGRLGNVDLGLQGTVESLLVARLGERADRRGFGLFRRRRPCSDDVVRVAICEALTALGGARSLERLARYRFEPSLAVSEAMKEGATRLAKRIRAA